MSPLEGISLTQEFHWTTEDSILSDLLDKDCIWELDHGDSKIFHYQLLHCHWNRLIDLPSGAFQFVQLKFLASGSIGFPSQCSGYNESSGHGEITNFWGLLRHSSNLQSFSFVASFQVVVSPFSMDLIWEKLWAMACVYPKGDA